MNSLLSSFSSSLYGGYQIENEMPAYYLMNRMIENDQIKDLYQTLGIKDRAKIDEIRALYSQKMSQEITPEMKNAFQLLCNPITKASYDWLLERARWYQERKVSLSKIDDLDRQFDDWYNAAYREEIKQIHDLLYQEFRDQKDLMEYVTKRTEEQHNVTYQHIARFQLNPDSNMWRPDKQFHCSKQQLDIVKQGDFYLYYVQDSQHDFQDYLLGSRTLILDVNKSTRLSGTRSVGTSNLRNRLLLNLPGYTWEYEIKRNAYPRLEVASRTEYFSNLGDHQYTNPGLRQAPFSMIVRDFGFEKRRLVFPGSLDKLYDANSPRYLQCLTSYDHYFKDRDQRLEQYKDDLLEDVRFTNPEDLSTMKAIYSSVQYTKTESLYTPNKKK